MLLDDIFANKQTRLRQWKHITTHGGDNEDMTPGAFWLTWVDFNISMDKQSHAQ